MSGRLRSLPALSSLTMQGFVEIKLILSKILAVFYIHGTNFRKPDIDPKRVRDENRVSQLKVY